MTSKGLEERREALRKYREQRLRKQRITRGLQRIICIILFIMILIGVSVFVKFLFEKEDSPDSVPAISPEIGTEITEPEPQRATILSGGDVMLHSPFLSSGTYKQADGSYYFHDIFRYIKDDYTNADFTVLNLETTINDTTYSGYPNFRSPASIVTALKDSGVDMCLIANNHIYDNGDHGLNHTLDALANHNMTCLGGRKDEADKDYVIEEINGIKVGFMNYTYSTRSGDTVMINSHPVTSTSRHLINTFSYAYLEEMYARIETNLSEMETAGVDYTITYLHWAEEYHLEESSLQREIAQRLCDLGVDALIGGHPHVVQPVDLMTSNDASHQMLCLYSVGNHLSNQRREYISSMRTGHTEDGILSLLTLEKDAQGTVTLVGADIIPTWVYRAPESQPAEYYIFSLKDSSVISKASELDIEADYYESIERTNAIIGDGVTKIQNALPITIK